MNRLYRKLLEHRDEDGIDSRVDNELISESKLSLLNNFAKEIKKIRVFIIYDSMHLFINR